MCIRDRIDNLNFLGKSGINTLEGNSIYIKNCSAFSVSNYVGELHYQNPLKILGSTHGTVSNFYAQNYAVAATPVDDSYGIYIADDCFYISLDLIHLNDSRGTNYARGVRLSTALRQHTLTNYSLTTSVATPDSFGLNIYEEMDNTSGRLRRNETRVDKLYVNASTVVITSGSGTPEGVVTGNVGSLYLRTNGGAGTSIYVKETGTGNTGWVAK